MKKIILSIILCTAPFVANAYPTNQNAQLVGWLLRPAVRSGDVGMEQTDRPRAHPDVQPATFSEMYRYYIGADFNESWTINDASLSGRATPSFDAMFGVRISPMWRIEANYYRGGMRYDGADFTENMAMINILWDMRIDALPKMGAHQFIVPYIGVGGGASFNSATGNAGINDTTGVVSATAGLAFEFTDWFAIDIGYRFMWMFSPDITMTMADGGVAHFDVSPMANQVRAGVRFNF